MVEPMISSKLEPEAYVRIFFANGSIISSNTWFLIWDASSYFDVTSIPVYATIPTIKIKIKKMVLGVIRAPKN